MADFNIVKNPDGTVKVAVTKTVTQAEEQVFGNLDEAVNYVKTLEQQEAEQPQQ